MRIFEEICLDRGLEVVLSGCVGFAGECSRGVGVEEKCFGFMFL